MAELPRAGSELNSGKYEIVRLLGQRGMGTVFEAEQRETHKRVEIDCLHPLYSGAPDVAAERLLREARALARIRHLNVVGIYDVGRDGPLLYLVMEFLRGETLSAYLQRQSVPAHELVSLLIDAMRSVGAAHKEGVIHRDIKPENIFVATVTDLARPIPRPPRRRLPRLSVRLERPSRTR